MNEGPHYMRAGEIARLVGVSERTVRRWISDGTLPSVKISGTRLVAKADLERLLSPASKALREISDERN